MGRLEAMKIAEAEAERAKSEAAAAAAEAEKIEAANRLEAARLEAARLEQEAKEASENWIPDWLEDEEDKPGVNEEVKKETKLNQDDIQLILAEKNNELLEKLTNMLYERMKGEPATEQAPSSPPPVSTPTPAPAPVVEEETVIEEPTVI